MRCLLLESVPIACGPVAVHTWWVCVDVDTRVGHHARKLGTKACEVTPRVPKPRSLPFDSAIIEQRDWRRSLALGSRRSLAPGFARRWSGSLGACRAVT